MWSMWRAGLVVLAGCSFVFTGHPDPVAPGELPVCTTSRAPIIADGIASVPPLMIGLFVIQDPHGVGDSRAENYALRIGLPAFAVAAAFAGAFVFGLHATGACRDAIDDALLALAREAAAGHCEPVIAFAKRLVQHDPETLAAFLVNPTFAGCFYASSSGE